MANPRPGRGPADPHPSSHSLMVLVFLVFLAFFSLPSLTLAHQSISYPTPISRDVACRISSNANCAGPCPTKFRRHDKTPNNPSITVRRGGTMSVNTLSNNHRGGFSRWSLVHVRDMYNKKAHNRNAFLYTCSDVRVTKCRQANRLRDCYFDNRNEYYRHLVTIPRVVPDGVYVLGWVWFGGGMRWGHFGDYYDCMFIRVRGGAYRRTHRPVFKTGPSPTKRNGRCVGTTNRIGVCWREPCPGGGKWTSYMKPAQFEKGRSPRALRRSWFKAPYRIPARKRGSAYVRSLTIRSADSPGRVIARATRDRLFHILLTRAMRTTVTCEVGGNVKRVTFYINGRVGRSDNSPPYSIAGDWLQYGRVGPKYAPWAFKIDRTYITLSCKAVGYDGVEHWRNVELSTLF